MYFVDEAFREGKAASLKATECYETKYRSDFGIWQIMLFLMHQYSLLPVTYVRCHFQNHKAFYIAQLRNGLPLSTVVMKQTMMRVCCVLY